MTKYTHISAERNSKNRNAIIKSHKKAKLKKERNKKRWKKEKKCLSFTFVRRLEET